MTRTRKPGTGRIQKSLLSNGAWLDKQDPASRRAVSLVLDLMAIPGTSGQEGLAVEYITESLLGAGVPEDSISTDQAHRRSPLDGQVGNLVCKLPGTIRGSRRLLMAHIDTVPLCVGAKPTVDGPLIYSTDTKTGVGADNRAGAAVVLNTALEILKNDIPHPPLTFFWPVQEEVGLHGVRHATLGLLGKPRLAFNFDGGSPETITIGATGSYRMRIVIQGLASHAGGAPEKGVSAIAIAALAIADLQREGWHGDVHRNDLHGTSNFGFITGGGAINVVADRVEIRAEARSHDAKFRLTIAEAFEKAFQKALREVRSIDGQRGKMHLERRLDYDAFCLDDDEPCVLAAEEAIREADAMPFRAISNGGLDANWMTARGIPTVTIGCGQRNAHTTGEQLDLPEFQLACRIGLNMATGEA